MTAESIRKAFRAGQLDFVDAGALGAWIMGQRWFATKASEVVQVDVRESVPLDDDPPLALAILEVRFPSGTHDLYQAPLGLRPVGEGDGEAICETGGWVVHEAVADPVQALRLGRLLGRSAVVEHPSGRLEFNALPGAEALGSASRARPMGLEQSNTSLVFGDEVVLKVFRRLGAGTNPELEMRRFLSERSFPSVAELLGWYDHRGELIDATLGIAERYVAGARNGWELTLDALAGGGEEWLAQLAELGGVTAELHNVLASDRSSPDFAPQERTSETMALTAAAIDTMIEKVFSSLPDNPALAPIAGRGEEVREYARGVTHGGGGGLLIRHHGDLHLGQTMLAPAGWMIVDFEGEPARPLPERRIKRSPLRDVAGMLRSLAYAASAVALQRGVEPPDDWEGAARGSFLEAYLERVDPSLLPTGDRTLEQTLSLFELEKAVYELGYEVDHRVDWVPIPVAAIERLLEGMAT